ncbi:hypothetical protein BW732_06690 [Vagococcus penaei]|uniref:WxL domain-containing protein n=2 Tax=Vagococcus penaei TaxID=633807 RepID=A0A1Q2D689_9ENTE|nr:hypothetical protein BW732_06690 [Vagococcus penaei]
MKFRPLGTLVVLTVLANIIFDPMIAKADIATELPSNGILTVESGTINPSNPDPENPITSQYIPDPENPEKSLSPTDWGFVTNGTDMSKGIFALTNLNFGTIKVGSQQAYAAPLKLMGKDEENKDVVKETRGNMIVFGDISGEATGYTISAQLTKQFALKNAPNQTLKGSTITYTNPLLVTSVFDGAPVSQITGQLNPKVVLDESGAAQDVVRANKGEGAGFWSLEFGQSKDYNGLGNLATDAQSVVLTIPPITANVISKGDYVAEVTWTLGAVK